MLYNKTQVNEQFHPTKEKKSDYQVGDGRMSEKWITCPIRKRESTKETIEQQPKTYRREMRN